MVLLISRVSTFSGEATNRSGFDTRPLLYSPLLNRNADCECEEDFQKRYSALKMQDDRRASLSGLGRDNMRVGNAESSNGGLFINGQFALLKNVELYLTAGYSIKSGQSAGFYTSSQPVLADRPCACIRTDFYR